MLYKVLSIPRFHNDVSNDYRATTFKNSIFRYSRLINFTGFSTMDLYFIYSCIRFPVFLRFSLIPFILRRDIIVLFRTTNIRFGLLTFE